MDYYYSGRSFIDYARDQAVALGGLPGSAARAEDNAYDAFRHALLMAKLTGYLGADTARSIGDTHEQEGTAKGADPRATNMDLYNNGVGRQEYVNWRAARESGDTKSLEQWIYDVVKAGKTINDFSDNRKWVEPPPSDSPNKGIWPMDPMGDMPFVISATIGNTPDPLVKTIRYVDPLILDLNGDGLKISRLNGAKSILFDTDADTIRTATAWASSEDGFLVLDRNANGSIDSGRELFGDETLLANGNKAANGFAALGELDSNTDGLFSALDTQFNAVRVWRDLNQDGISQAGELKTLADSNVRSVTLVSTAVNQDYGDALLVRDGNFTRANGSIGQAGSFILAQNHFVRTFAPITVNVAAEALTNIGGTGWVRDLKQAATLNPHLISAANAAANAVTRVDYKNAVEQLIREWGSSSEFSSASKQALADGFGLIMSDPVDEQERGWMEMAVKASEASRSAFREGLPDANRSKFDAMRERMVGGLDKLHAYEAFTGHTFLNWAQVQRDATNYTPRFVSGGALPVEVWVPLSQIIYENRNAFVSSQVGYIRVSIPQPSNGLPHVTAIWSRLVDDATVSLMPTLRLAKYIEAVTLNITDQGVQFDFSAMDTAVAAVSSSNRREGTALVLDIDAVYGNQLSQLGWAGTSQIPSLLQEAAANLDVKNAFIDMGYVFPDVKATRGSDARDAYSGDVASNIFNAGGGDDLLGGGEGTDALSGGLGNDRIFGGAGDDQLSGDDGNDTLDGGTGDDRLNGGLGNNIYLFERGSGQDAIYGGTYSPTGPKSSILQFRGEILPSDITLKQVYDITFWGGTAGLEISIAGTTDKIIIGGFFQEDNPVSNYYNPIQIVKFTDGTVWDIATIAAKTLIGTGSSDSIRGTILDDVISGGLGVDTLNGASGNDQLFGGEGDDALEGEAGNDILLGDSGNDSLIGGYGNDTLYGGDGSDLLRGDEGVNFLFGEAGNDTLDSGEENDSLSGGSGSDTLRGRGGDDTLSGGTGDDVLYGGSGNNTYVFNIGDGRDIITPENSQADS